MRKQDRKEVDNLIRNREENGKKEKQKLKNLYFKII